MPVISDLPTITSITATDPTQTDAGTVHYTVTFSKPVLGVTIDQFSLATSGGIGGAGITDVTPVAGSNLSSYTVTVNTGSGSGSVALQFTGSNVHDTNGYYVGPYQSESKLNVSSPASFAIGDVNGDGKLDVVMGTSFFVSMNYVSVALNDGTGHFSSASSTSSPGILPLLALADLNGDGKLDIAQVSADGAVNVRFGNGNGTFGADTSYSTGRAYQAPKVIDVTGDGVLDIVIGSTVLPGNGNGTFGTAISTNLGVNSIAYGDFNGDGKLDLVTRNSSNLAIALSFGNGDGTFQAPSSPVGTATSVLTGDFNGDGKLDMAAVSSATISILLGNGDGTFTSSGTTLQAAGTIGSGAVADINGDGKADLVVVASNNTLSTFYGHGDGTFGQVRVSPLDKTAGQIGVGDLNGDGKADVLVGYQFGTNPFTQSSGADILLTGSSNETGPAYTIVRTSPALTITDGDVTLGADGNNYINAAHFHGGATTLAGTGNAGDTIAVTDAQTHAVVGTTTVGQDGTWSLGVSGLQDGTTYSYVAAATDSQGNSTVGPAFTFTVDATASLGITGINLSADSSLSDPKITLQGTTDAAAQVTVSVGGTDVIVSSATGSWQFNSQVVPYGLTTIAAKFSDAAGNVGASPTYTLIRGGYTLVSSTQIANAVVVNSFFTVDFNAAETGAIVLSGAGEIVRGTSTGATIYNGGSQGLEYGTASGTLVQAGGTQLVSFQGTAKDTVLYGTQTVGNTAIHTTIKAGGLQNVYVNGSAYGTVIEALGTQSTAGADHDAIVFGTQYVTGSSANATIGSGGNQYDYGTATGALVQSGGAQHVYQGGSASGTTVAAGGYQDVYQATVTNTVLDGNQQVLGNGHAAGTVINAGGRQYVGSGGATTGTTIAAGGFQYVDAGATDGSATINGGYQFVAGAATATTVSGGGEQDVGAGGNVSNAHLDGGSEHVYAGGLLQNVDFGGSDGAALVLDTPAGLAGSIANFGADDHIDFRNTVISSVDVDGANNLTVTTDGGQSYSWALLAQYSASSFVLSADGNGGTMLSYTPPQQTLLAAAH
ncbi:beta strand repeat-containing protein [Bradyrhizobium sp. Pa8]|uniref:beta strand repeat-containing protein n=1 Tax=Bradyrhizobium sp. Pa8 TaxID=3386552 RepID=UPI00403F7781